MTHNPPTPPTRRPLRRWALRAALGLLAGFLALTTFLLVDGWSAFGKAAEGPRLERMQASAQWADGAFENPQPLYNDVLGSFTSFADGSDFASPTTPIPVVHTDPTLFDTPPPTGLRVTWFGHSSLLIEIDGHRILTDPLWGDRASPYTWIGPERWYAPTLPLDRLPEVDAIVLSHDHYDHLDYPTIVALSDRDTTFIAPLGVGAHLAAWGVPENRIVELDWWEKVAVGDLELVCTPSRHASGRHLLDQNHTLWAGWAVIGKNHRAFFSGDTGLFPGMREIGKRLGPFDVAMIEVGAYDAAWPDWHIGPEQAVRADELLGGKVLIPIHWGLFNLAAHGWTEPIERTVAAAEASGVKLAVPRPGESVEPHALPPFERWWPEVPWRTAAEYPIVSTRLEALNTDSP